MRVQHDAHLADPAGSHRRAQGEIFGLYVGDKGVGRPPLELDVVMESAEEEYHVEIMKGFDYDVGTPETVFQCRAETLNGRKFSR